MVKRAVRRKRAGVDLIRILKDDIAQAIADNRDDIVKHLPLAFHVAYRWPSALPLSDKIQECAIALMTALRKYDPSKSKFGGYAARGMQIRLVKADCDQQATIRIPHSGRRWLPTVRKLIAEYGRIPTYVEWKSETGRTARTYHTAISAYWCSQQKLLRTKGRRNRSHIIDENDIIAKF